MTQTAPVQKHPRYPSSAPVDVVAGAEIMQQLPLLNISVGGVFIRTSQPLATGSPVRLRLHAGVPLGLLGHVVHVIDEAASARKSHPAGMGVQFDAVSAPTLALLQQFVEGLAAQGRRERARRYAVRFLDQATVHVHVDRALVADLWSEGLKQGGLYVANGEVMAPPLGALVKVMIGSLELSAEVVHLDRGGAGLQLKDLEGAKRTALDRFLDGSTEALAAKVHKPLGPPLGKVLAVARRLFMGIDDNDGFGAVGLPATAAEHEVRARFDGMRRLFGAPPPEASPPQRARIEAATRALDRLEPVVLARVAALRREAEIVNVPGGAAKVRAGDELKALFTAAGEHERRGERVEARAAWARILELAPEHPLAMKKLETINAALEAAQAMDLLDRAEVFADGMGMHEEAVTLAREAARLSRARTVRLRALRVFAKTSHLEEAVLLADELIDVDPADQHALQALVVLHERGKAWREAARAGEALLRLKPADIELQKRVKKIVELARKSLSGRG